MQKRRTERSSIPGLLLLTVGIVTLAVAVIHPAVTVVDTVATGVVSGASPAIVVLPETVLAESGGLLLISVAATVLGLAMSVARVA
jgi:hypothetical protein